MPATIPEKSQAGSFWMFWAVTIKFKILIPITSLKELGNFKVKINTQMETKPVFYGKAPSVDLQDYALTAYECEDIKTVG